jgi:glyoxylase-like metal-dependent hydrolase (beta-lactamase superfamily II)
MVESARAHYLWVTMKTCLAALLLAVPAVAAPLKVTPIVGSPQGFFVTATLVTGEKEAILIDTAFTLADAHRITAAVLDSGKKLTTIFVTHAHPDHYFGTAVLKAAFPEAKLVARPEVVTEIEKQWKGKVAQWGPIYGANLSVAPAIPEALTKDSLTLEGETLVIHGGVQGDDAHNAWLWIPSAKAVVGADTLYNGVHLWTAETKAANRTAWLATLDRIEKLKPELIIAGHKVPDAKDDASAITFTREYLKAFDVAVKSSKTANEALEKVKAKYPSAALDILARIGTEAQYAK